MTFRLNAKRCLMIAVVATFASAAAADDLVQVMVDVAKPAGATGKIRRLHGTNLAAPLDSDARDNTEALKVLDIPLTRLHDAPLEGRGQRLVDVSCVFPLFHLDPQDPKNYYFAETDDYIQNCLNYGSKVLYRLGESIDHSKKRRRVFPPKDFDKWADICINIIRHYNEGWADGFHDNIEYWEIWNEADGGPRDCWMGTWSDYVRLYVTASKKIKSRFPNIKVGGPAMTGLHFDEMDQFLSECKRQNAPLDFFSWHCYTSSPNDLIGQPGIARTFLDQRGFTKAELHLNEWHCCFGGDFNGDPAQYRTFVETMGGPDAAAGVCAILSGWQDTPLAMGNYYTGTGVTWPGWGFYGLCGPHDLNKCYFAMKAFNLTTKYENRVATQVRGDEKNTWALAGRKKNGSMAVLVSCFKSPAKRVAVQFTGCFTPPKKCSVRIVDGSHELETVKDVQLSGTTVTIPKPAGSAVFLVEIE